MGVKNITTKDGFLLVPEFERVAAPTIDPSKTAEERADIFLQAFSDPSGEGFAKIGQELILPMKELIDYNGFANRILKTYTIDARVPGKINGKEVWRSW